MMIRSDEKWGDQERRSFMAQIAEPDIAMEYEHLASACEALGWPRPSWMLVHDRRWLVSLLRWKNTTSPMRIMREAVEHVYKVAVQAADLDAIAYNAGFDAGYAEGVSDQPTSRRKI